MIRHVVRGLTRMPAFTSVIVGLLAVGIGSTATLFSLVNGVLLRPLPYADPGRLVTVWNESPIAGHSLPAASALDARDYRRLATTFEGFAMGAAGENTGAMGILGGPGGAPERLDVSRVSSDFFPLLGVTPILGRNFTAEEERFVAPPPGQEMTLETLPPQVVMLSHRLWRRRYGGDPDIVGRTIQVDAIPNQVIGILPPDFHLYLPAEAHLMKDADLWLPLYIDWTSPMLRRTTVNLTAIGRLKAGVTLERAQADMDVVARRLAEEHAVHRENDTRIRLVPLQQDVVKHARPTLLLIFAAAGVLLLIACANSANLLLVRATSRRRELAVRVALGASRRQLLRQLLTEGIVLGTLGGAAGFALAVASVTLLRRWSPPNLPRLETVSIDWAVLGFAVAVSLGAAMLIASTPALQASGTSPADALAGGRAGPSRRQSRTYSALTVFELALSLVLLVGAGLLVRSLFALHGVRPGFEAEKVLTFQVALPMLEYPTEERARFAGELTRGLEALPGVTGVGLTSQLPFTGLGHYSSYSDAARPPDANAGARPADVRIVTPGYFAAIGTRLLAGRDFAETDDASRPPVVIVDETIARRLWPGEPAVGKRLRFSGGRPDTVQTVIGVVEHVRQHQLSAEGPGQIYRAYSRVPTPWMTYIVRTRGEPADLVPLVRRELAVMDPELPARDLLPLTHFVAAATAPVRFSLLLMQTFGTVAALLASVGLYGVIAFTVGRRTKEFGIRQALGATPAAMRRMVLRGGLELVGLSVALGLGIAVLSTRLLSRLLYGVGPLDPPTLLTVIVLLTAVAMMACYLPARRASRVQPADALRTD